MLKFIKKLLIIIIHLSINFLFFTYRIIHKFLEKNKGNIKNTLEKLDNELIKMV